MLGAAGPSPVVLRGLYAWLDGLPLSRPKRHLARDFSDGGGALMLAEIVKHFHPRLVDLHNYTPTCNTDQKLSNWHILNRKVFPKLSLCVSETDIRKVVASTPGAIEPILCALREKVEAGAVCTDLPGAASAGSGPSGVDAAPPWAELTAPAHAGLPSPPALSSMKTAQNESVPEKMGQCTCRGWDPAGRPWDCPDPGGQLLEDKEQALAILQEMVKRQREEHSGPVCSPRLAGPVAQRPTCWRVCSKAAGATTRKRRMSSLGHGVPGRGAEGPPLPWQAREVHGEGLLAPAHAKPFLPVPTGSGGLAGGRGTPEAPPGLGLLVSTWVCSDHGAL
ncbi:uncharacterized protein LOC123650033 isoform X2 [Lemur catta]|uniref:uncharacterized protein LOC123650033 isoform X2 n=1 Tax=Lemur catta TaxID=9447 RepID=UPI001E268D68|nr:uncharacterized protein LOC123650033 isoform X2 [Lemur catta]